MRQMQSFGFAAILLLVIGVPAAQAVDRTTLDALVDQVERENELEAQDRPRSEFSNIRDPLIRNRAEQLVRERGGLNRQPVRLTSKPWLGPTGEQLVGIVANRRMLTKPQLDRRVDMLLKQMPGLEQAGLGVLTRDGAATNARQLAEDRRIIFEGQMLAEWLETTALAVHAEQLGLGVTNEEVQQALDELTRQSVEGGGQGEVSRLRGVVLPDAELRQEIKDALLVEKLVQKRTRESVSEAQMQELYRSQPRAFLIPTRARAWQLFYPIVRTPTKKQANDIYKEMSRLRKQLERAKTEQDFAKLEGEIAGRGDVLQREIASSAAGVANFQTGSPRDSIVISDMGWVAQGDMVPGPVQQAIFRLEPGETSKILVSDLGMHVIKVLERVDGQQGRFEEARPQIEAMLFEKVKDAIYESLTQNMEMYSNSSGLKQWSELPPEIAAGAGQTSTSLDVTTGEPDLGRLRGPKIDPSFRPDLTPPPVAAVLEENILKKKMAPDDGATAGDTESQAPAADRFNVPPMR